jgi:hypothetical protein
MNLSIRILAATKLMLLISLSGLAQINYQKTLNGALEKAATSNKPVFVHIGLPKMMMGMPVKSLSDRPEIADFYNEHFVNYLMPADSPEFGDYRERYQLNSFPALFFLNADGNLIYKSPKPAGSAKEYIAYGQETLDRIKSGKSLFAYEQKYKDGALNKEQLKEYIQLRTQSGLFDNSELAERYVEFLTIAQLNDYQDVLFILKAGPLAFGKAYRMAFTNTKITDSIYRYEPADERIAMNNRIISNTFNTAVAKKDYSMLNNVVTFIRNTHGKNYSEANNQATLKSLAFYKAVKDTINFYSTASYYYDRHYMRQNVDSLRKLALKNQQARDEFKASMEKSQALAKKRPDPPAQPNSNIVRVVTRRVIVPGTNNIVANALNSIAWDFYTMGTRNMNHLSKALQWSMRSIEIDPAPAHYDTLAHIFYRMGLFDEALLNQNKAIALLMKIPDQKKQLANAQAEAAKMQERTL